MERKNNPAPRALSVTAGGVAVARDYRVTAGGRVLVIPYYLPEQETAVFKKQGHRSLGADLVMPLLRMGIRVVNAADPESAARLITGGCSLRSWESYEPVRSPEVPKPRSLKVVDDRRECERIRQEMPAGPARDAALAYYEKRGSDGFTEAERDRARRSGEANRRRLERIGIVTGGMSDSEVVDRLHAEMLKKSYAGQPDIDGDFDKKAATDV